MILDNRTVKERLLDAALLELRFMFKPSRVSIGGIRGVSRVSFHKATLDRVLESKYEIENLSDTHEIVYFVEKASNPRTFETKVHYTVRQK